MTSDPKGAETKFTVSILYMTVYAYRIERICIDWGVWVELVEGVWMSCCGECLSPGLLKYREVDKK
jgi:hypothetical protein